VSRSRQAFRLAAHLTQVGGVEVELHYDSGPVWHVSWTDGPLREEMRGHLERALAGDHFADMRDRQLHLHRGETPRAWAARTIASRREGTVRPAVAEGAARSRALPKTYTVRNSDLTPEDHALLQHVEDLIENTPFQERASAPEDEPLIEQLLSAAGGRSASKYTMARTLLRADRAPDGTGPAPLRVRGEPKTTGGK
jgi:hypothetical protein